MEAYWRPSRQMEHMLRGRGIGWPLFWDSPHRVWHSMWHHLDPMLEKIDKLPISTHEKSPLVCAAWWHDAIYTPGSKTNEEESLEAYFKHRKYAPQDFKDLEDDQLVTRMISATMGHMPTGDELVDTFLRLDIGPLFEPSDITTDEILIWAEHRNAGITNKDYAAGRLSFLEKMEDHPWYKGNDNVVLRHRRLWIEGHVK